MRLAFQEGDGGDDDRAFDDELHGRAHAEQYESIVERPDDETAESSSKNEPTTAEQAASSDDGGDRRDLPVRRLAERRASGRIE
jgi:hypothetical protein